MQKFAVMTHTVIAAAAVTQHRFVALTGVHATAGGNAFGISTSDAADGDQLAMDCLGSSIVEASGAIEEGDGIEVGAAGVAITADTGTVVARALQAAADGDLFEVFIIPN
ncbi:DUF2190 family protein [Marinobacter sp.]|uniref:DUF2190 family protein n=1 Tax=Marinobacter sp. TaxID=50741 RepID=UPI0034A1A925